MRQSGRWQGVRGRPVTAVPADGMPMANIPDPVSNHAALLHAAILDHSGYGIIATTPEGVITVFNRAAERMLGYRAEEVIHQLTPAPFHDPQEVVARAAEFSAELGVTIAPGFEVFVARARRGLPNEYEWSYIRKDGSRFRILLSVTALRDEQGVLIGFLGMVVDVTERLWARRELAEREAQYRQLFEDNPNAMLLYDIDSLSILAVNDALLQLYGYTEPELIGQPLHLLWAPDECGELMRLIGLLRNDTSAATFHQRWRNVRKGGQEFHVETTSRRQSVGERRARFVLVHEISDTVRVERLAEDQARFLNQLLDALPMPVFYKDRAGNYLGANPAYFNLLGLSPEHFLGRTVDQIAGPELAAIYRAADQLVFDQPDVPHVYTSQVRDGAGDLRDVVFHKAAFRDHQGRVAGLIGILIDITEQRRAAQALRESEARLMQVLHNSPLPIFVIDDQHRVVLWNLACERVIGIPAAEMLGTRDAWRAFYAEPRPVMADLIVSGGDEGNVRALYGLQCARSALNPEAFEAEGFFPTLAEGEGRWLYFSASPLRDAEGSVVGAIETLVDITERKRAEAEARLLTEDLEARVLARTNELARANEELRQAMGQLVQAEKLASLGTLVAGVAHELNTPLGNMRTVASSFEHRLQAFAAALASNSLHRSMLDEFVAAARDAAGIIERNAQRATELIGDFKQVAVDQTSTRRREFDLAKVIDEIHGALRPRLRQTPHQLEMSVPSGIMMDSYPGPLEQVLLNFFNNSLMHGFAAGEAGLISLRAGILDDGRAELVYADNGQGMDEATAARAFDPFFTTRLGKGGSGLGLYIVFNLVTGVLGGEVVMDSRPGEGTRFRLVLPRVAPVQRVTDGEGEAHAG